MSCIKEKGRVDVDLEKDGIELAIEHEIKAKDLEATEPGIKTVFSL